MKFKVGDTVSFLPNVGVAYTENNIRHSLHHGDRFKVVGIGVSGYINIVVNGELCESFDPKDWELSKPKFKRNLPNWFQSNDQSLVTLGLEEHVMKWKVGDKVVMVKSPNNYWDIGFKDVIIKIYPETELIATQYGGVWSKFDKWFKLDKIKRNLPSWF